MGEHHDTPLNRHVEVHKAVEQTRHRFWWPCLTALAAVLFNAASIPRKPTSAQPDFHSPCCPRLPLLQITMHLVTALPAATSGDDAIVVMADWLPKVAKPPWAASKETTTVAEPSAVSNAVVKLHRHPEAVISNNLQPKDAKFPSKVWQALFAETGAF